MARKAVARGEEASGAAAEASTTITTTTTTATVANTGATRKRRAIKKAVVVVVAKAVRGVEILAKVSRQLPRPPPARKPKEVEAVVTVTPSRPLQGDLARNTGSRRGRVGCARTVR